MSALGYRVVVENDAAKTVDTIDEALALAQRRVYLNPERIPAAIQLLRAGLVFSYCYGFASVDITPLGPKAAVVDAAKLRREALATLRARVEESKHAMIAMLNVKATIEAQVDAAQATLRRAEADLAAFTQEHGE